ncbi:DUF397 domain-containing protein [Streptomyces sp. NPDC091278]|uniref:DUF397 domain-containing protein n=1 Tax=unclassified Streptomyces TaxID=2593676 RepID=UPI00344B4645
MNSNLPAITPNPESNDFAWYKSSYSDGTGNNCVEVADTVDTHAVVHIRDSKIPSGARLRFTPGAFSTFVDSVGDSTPAQI